MLCGSFSCDKPILSELSSYDSNMDNQRMNHHLDGEKDYQGHDRTCTSQTYIVVDLEESFVPHSDGSGPVFHNLAEENGQESTSHLDCSISLTHSNKEYHLPSRFDDYIVDGKYKYGIT